MKEKLLVLELWGLGDLVIATPFLRAASTKYEVTLVAKPYAKDLQPRFWPNVQVIPFVAPWTAFTGKYRLLRWPWRELLSLRRKLSQARFDAGLSARWDPRDHLLLAAVRARMRLGFPRTGSRLFLTKPLERPDPKSHRSEYWKVLAGPLGLELQAASAAPSRRTGEILVHTGAGQPIRVWPLDRYRNLVAWLRARGCRVQVACDVDQRDWWKKAGEQEVRTPESVTELLSLIDRAAMFIGNDSGPGHLAALADVPTFTIFGPQLPAWFAPIHPDAVWMDGKPCPYKPCADYCRFNEPLCLTRLTEPEVTEGVGKLLRQLGLSG